jgi:hypothetical protein
MSSVVVPNQSITEKMMRCEFLQLQGLYNKTIWIHNVQKMVKLRSKAHLSKREKVTDNNKDTSLLYCGNNCGRSKFYGKGSWL